MTQIAATTGTSRAPILLLLAGLLLAPALAWAQGPATRMVVFGDSLSDTGNAFIAGNAGHTAGANNTPPQYLVDALLVPSAAYPRGGHNLTNGAPWAQLLARSMGFAANADPALRSENPRATNYAVAGARAYEDGINLNLSGQVGLFLEDFAGVAPPEALYVIEVGGSDVRDTLFFADFTIPGRGVQAIAANIQLLHAAGARRFLVWNAPDIGLIPSIRSLEPFFPGIAPTATFVSGLFNGGLASALSQLDALPGIRIDRFDLFTMLQSLYYTPAAFGLAEVNRPCITPNVAPFKCRNPDTYLFWDGIHPTAAVHAIVAGEIEAMLAP